jgi:putative copper export protein/mono/diheme cytochrome c family protein
VYALALAVRFTHLTCSVLLLGSAMTLVLAGRSDRPTALRWERHLLAWSRAWALTALVSGLVQLSLQTALFEGRATAALEAPALARVLFETHVGRVWLVRHGFLVLLSAFLLLPLDVARRPDWRAARGEAMLLSAVALVSIAASGHAAAVEPGTTIAIAVDGAHVLAAGVWAGGLLPLALLLRAAGRDEGADARPYAVLAVRRFSRCALSAIVALALSGTVNAAAQVGSVAGLVGTPYGRLLLLKLGLLIPALALAGVNRAVHLPRLSGDGPTIGRPAMRRLTQFVVGEGVLALGILGAVAAMGATPPALHDAPEWPFSFRLTTAALEGAPDAATRALVGGQVAVLGVVGLLTALALRGWRLPLAGGALALLGAGAGLALPPLSIDAYPTTYLRPSVPYQAASIAEGQSLYRANCTVCHGTTGAGDGPGGRGLPRRPADLRAPHTAQHTAGDLFWWITHGIPGSGMPPFGGHLADEQRWDVINFLRALASGYLARTMGPVAEPDRPWLVAPDFTFAVGPTPARALKDYRARRTVLVVLYTLPASRPRMAQLAQRYDILVTLGTEVIAVPSDAAPDAVRQLGAEPRVFFPVVTEGAGEIVAAYRLFAGPPHAELLVDRQGYVRAIARGNGEATELNALLAQIQQLNEEKTPAPAPEEHVH